MEITIFTRYTSIGASSRLRYFAYLDALIQGGINVEIDSLLPHLYLIDLYSGRRISGFSILIAYAKRVLAVQNASSHLLIEYELLPYIPFWIERLLIGRRKYVLNFDDNLWCNYENNQFLCQKYNKLVSHASGVIVANEFLLEKVTALNSNVIKIPTPVDLHAYKGHFKKFERLTVVWIGTPATFFFIEAFADVFEKLSETIDYDLLVVASSQLRNEKFKTTKINYVDWSVDREAEWLLRSHVGVMPLTSSHSFSSGKSAYKILQYFAAGLPVIASCIGENNMVIQHGVNGFLAATFAEMEDALRNLLTQSELRTKLAVKAKMSAQKYSLEANTSPFVEFIRRSFQHK